MKFARRCLLAGLVAVLAPLSFAQADYPNKPIALVVPFAAGGGLDVTARVLAEKMKDVLGQSIVIANRPGAGSSVGARAVAAAPADGYTLFITSGSAFAYQHLLVQGYDLKLEDFAPVAGVMSNPSVIVASMQLPVKTLAELVDYATANPGKISFCSTGAGGLNHLQLEMLKRVAKSRAGKDFNVTHVPYNGVAPALVGIRDQSVQACTLPYTALVKNLDGKELRVLATQTPRRLPWLPNVGTTGEQGFRELDANESFVVVAAPKGTPAAVLSKLEGALRTVMADATVRKKLEDLEVQPLFMNSADTRKWLEDDVRRFSVVIREAGLATAK